MGHARPLRPVEGRIVVVSGILIIILALAAGQLLQARVPSILGEARIVDSGVSISGLNYGCVLENSGGLFAAEQVSCLFSGYDAQGYVRIQQQTAEVAVIKPGDRAAVTGDFATTPGVVRWEASAKVGGWGLDSYTLPRVTEAATNKVAPLSSGVPSYKVTGYAVNDSTNPTDSAYVNEVAYDEDGKIVGGGWTPLSSVPPHGRQAFSFSFTPSAPLARSELYVHR